MLLSRYGPFLGMEINTPFTTRVTFNGPFLGLKLNTPFTRGYFLRPISRTKTQYVLYQGVTMLRPISRAEIYKLLLRPILGRDISVLDVS